MQIVGVLRSRTSNVWPRILQRGDDGYRFRRAIAYGDVLSGRAGVGPCCMCIICIMPPSIIVPIRVAAMRWTFSGPVEAFI